MAAKAKRETKAARGRPRGSGAARPKPDKPRLSFTELAYQQIRAQILNNEMSAGFQITEKDLAERLNISRTPTREALLRLAAEGLIDIWPRHGMRVKHISVDDLREIYQIITVLEAAAAGLAARRRPPAETIAEMRRSIAAMDKALSKDDLLAWADADRQFHRQLAQASGNQRLVDVVDTYTGQAHRLRMLTLRLRPKPTNSNRDHEEVVNAIAAGDAKRAEEVHRRHREKSGEMLINLLQAHGLGSL